ncbi:MAG: hypothetical protein ACRD2A_02405 [Vicinamibacterales bacterium]
MSDLEVAGSLFQRWLNDAHARHFRLEGGDLALEDETSLALAVHHLIGGTDDAEWLATRYRIEDLLTEAIPASFVLWVPAGDQLPGGEPPTSEFIEHVRKAATRLGPNERSYVSLPINLRLRKNADSGGVVSATGGLNPHWARFTERVRGQYDLDSTQLHRLPESEEHLEALIDEIVERAKTLETGQVTEIDTINAWTVQRLPEQSGVTVIGWPPRDLGDIGLAVRRGFRKVLAAAVPSLRSRDADLRALVVIGPYSRVEQEGATTAMRGYDPALYSGIDFICLVADGLVKPLIQPRTV